MTLVEDKKQSLILGALTSSAGIFVTKLMGLFYMVPFTALAGESNLAFYSYGYGVYENLLNISLAGLPYAIATMIAKYSLKEDYKSIEYIRKLSQGIMLGFGFLCVAIVFLGLDPIARYITPADMSLEDLQKTKTVLMLISLAFISVPLLSGVRGYFQGLRDLKLYSVSQVIEQFSRITFLLTVGYIAVAILKADGIYAIYGAVLSAFVSSVLALVHIYCTRKHVIKEMEDKAAAQLLESQSKKAIARELLSFSIPFMISSVLGNSLSIVNSFFFSKAMDAARYTAEETKLLTSMLNLTTSKLTSIPHFLVIGYSSAIIPYVTTSYEKNDLNLMKKYILDALDSVTYLGLPLCFFLFAIGVEIYYVMYGAKSSFVLGGEVLRWQSLSGLLGTVSPIVTSLAMATRLRRQNLSYMVIGFLVKFVTFFPLIKYTGYSGAVTSSVLCSLTIMGLNLLAIKKSYDVDYSPYWDHLGKMAIGLLCMFLSFKLLWLVGIRVIDQPRLIALIELGVYGVVGVVAYLASTSFLHVPEDIFHLGDTNIFAYALSTLKRIFRREK